jgi:hypothetical protein
MRETNARKQQPKTTVAVKLKICVDPFFVEKMRKMGLMGEGMQSKVFTQRSEIPFFLTDGFKSPAKKRGI